MFSFFRNKFKKRKAKVEVESNFELTNIKRNTPDLKEDSTDISKAFAIIRELKKSTPPNLLDVLAFCCYLNANKENVQRFISRPLNYQLTILDLMENIDGNELIKIHVISHIGITTFVYIRKRDVVRTLKMVVEYNFNVPISSQVLTYDSNWSWKTLYDSDGVGSHGLENGATIVLNVVTPIKFVVKNHNELNDEELPKPAEQI